MSSFGAFVFWLEHRQGVRCIALLSDGHLVVFVLVSFFTHTVGYSFGGFLNRWPWNGRLWPKGIDYLYYLFGTLVLAVLLAQIYGESEVLLKALKWEVFFGIFLFNMKIFKTSYEIFPHTLGWRDGWIRDLFIGRVW